MPIKYDQSTPFDNNMTNQREKACADPLEERSFVCCSTRSTNLNTALPSGSGLIEFELNCPQNWNKLYAMCLQDLNTTVEETASRLHR